MLFVYSNSLEHQEECGTSRRIEYVICKRSKSRQYKLNIGIHCIHFDEILHFVYVGPKIEIHVFNWKLAFEILVDTISTMQPKLIDSVNIVLKSETS